MNKRIGEKVLKRALKRKISFTFSLFIVFLITGMITSAFEIADTKDENVIEQRLENEDQNYQIFFNYEYLKSGKSKDRTKKEFAETIREVNKYYQMENGSNFGKDKVVEGNGVVVGTYNSTSGSKETEVERKVEATKLEYLSIESIFSINPIITNPDIEKNTPEFKIEYPKISIMDKPLCIFPTIPITVNVKNTQPIEVNSIENANISVITPTEPNEKIVTIALPTTPKGYDITILNPPASPKINTVPVITVLNPVDITFQGTGFGQGTGIRFNGSQGIAAMNFDSYSTTGIEITANETKVSWIGTMTAGGSSNLPLSSSYNFTNFNTFISDVLDHNVEVTGNYIMKSTATSKFPMFISLNPYEVGKNSSTDKTFDFKGTLTLYGSSSANNGGILGIEHQLLAGGSSGTTAIGNVNSGATTSILKNSGVIDLYSGYNMIGIMIDTEYFNNNQNSYFKKRPQTRNDGIIKISEGAFNSIGIDFGYYLVKNAANLRGPNSDVYLGNIEIDGQQSYGYRQKYYGNQYYDMVAFNGSNGIIKVRGSQNVGISIAEGLSTGDPIANAQSMQIEVGGNQNIGFLRNNNTSATNNQAMVLDDNKIGNTFDFLSTATQSTLIRSDIYEVILDKDLTVTTAGEKNSIMQAGGTGKVTLNDGRSIDANMDQFYALTAGDFLSSAGAKAENRGTINIKGTESIGIAVAAGNAGANSGDINYIGDKGTLIYNLGNFSITKGTLNISGSESKALFNQNGTISITNSNLNINASNGAIGISSFGGYIFSTIGKNLKIAVDDTASLTSKGIAVYAGEGAEIILRAAEIEVKEGAAGVAAFDAGTSIDLTGAELKYSGEGYAAYSDGFGTINLTNASIILEGKATGVELNLLDPKVTLNNTTITMMSNDATVANLKNATGLLSNNLKTTVEGSLGLGVSIIDGSNGSGGFYDKYKIATVDGGDLTFDADMDKYSQADTTDGYFYSRRFLGQRLQLNVDTGVTVTAETDTAYAAEYFGNQVVGLEMSSSSFATSATDAQINLAANSKVTADRIDKGTGAIGLYINFGKINIADGAKVEVEKGANVVNDNGIGIYAVNGSTVINAGDIEVAGKEAIGILGMAYRENSLNNVIVDEFGTGGIFADQGKVNITNSKNIVLNGTGTIGIYGYNNNSAGVKGNVLITNTASGVVTVGNSSSSNAAIGIYGDKATISNQGTVSVGDGGVAIYAKNGTEVTDLGTLDLGADGVGVMLDGISDLAATAVTVTSNNTGTLGKTAIFYKGTGAETKNVNVAVNASALDKGTAVYAEDMSVVSSGILSIGTSGVGIYVKGSTTNTGTNKGTITLETGKNGAVGMYTKTANILNDTTIGIINVNDTTQIGMYAEGVNAKAINKGTINLNTDDSTGIYVKSGAVTELDAGNNIIFNGKSSVGAFAENSSVNFKDNFTFSNTNENKNIYVYGKGATVGIDAGKTITVNGVSAPSTVGNKTVGIYLENAGTASIFNGIAGQLVVTNEAVGIYSKDNNTLNVNVTAAGEKTMGVFIDGASAITGSVNATGSSTAGAVGVYGSSGVVNVGGGGLTLNTNSGKGTGMYLTDGASAAGGIITVNNTSGIKNIGVYYSKGTASGTVTNSSAVSLAGSDSIGIYAADGITLVNSADITSAAGQSDSIASYVGGGSQLTSNGTIALNDTASGIGIYTEEGKGINSGTIALNGTAGSMVGMVSEAKAGKTAAAENTSTITAGNNLGMYIAGPGASSGKNTGNITATGKGTGVYVDGSGNSFNGTGGTITSNAVGIYLKNTDTNKITTGTLNIASGGVGVFGENAKIDFAVNVAGTGAVGVAAKANSVISGNITTGQDSIGVYVLDNTVSFANANITTGTNSLNNSVGILINSSVGTYTMNNVNVNAKNGVGIYLNGTTQGINLTHNGTINTTDGVGIYVDNGTILTTGITVLNINGGTGVYIEGGTANLGATGNLTFNFLSSGGIGVFNNGGIMNLGTNVTITGSGSLARTINGSLSSSGNLDIGEGATGLMGIYDAGVAMSHSINNSGTITVVSGGIGLAAIKETTNPTLPLTITNTGTINTSGISSTNNSSIGVYTDVANVVNTGIINVGNNGVGIYSNYNGVMTSIQNNNMTMTGTNGIGVYIKGATNGFTANNITSTGTGNTGVVLEETTGNINVGTITLKEESTGVFITGAGVSVIDGTIVLGNGSTSKSAIGIVAENGTNMTLAGTASIITGDNGIGVYAEGNGTTVTVSNASNITVGTDGIYMYSKDAALNFTGNITANNQIGIVTDGGTVNSSGSIITVQNGGLGAYIKGAASSMSGATIAVQGGTPYKYSMGVYYDGAIIGTTPIIAQTGNYTIGMIFNNSTGTTSSGVNIGSLTEKKQIGIKIKENSDITIAGNVSVAGDENIGVYARNSNVTINGDTLIGNSSEDTEFKNSSIGSYLKAGTYKGTGSLVVGNYSIGIFGEELLGENIITQTGNNMSVGKHGIGIYASGNGEVQLAMNNKITIDSEDAIGVYTENAASSIIGDIKIGSDSSIGILSIGTGNINYSGILDIEAKNITASVGIYKKGTGIITTSGNWNIGNNGYGIYAEQEITKTKTLDSVTINNSANITLGMSAIGIFSDGNNEINNYGNIIVGSTNVNGAPLDFEKHENSVGIYLAGGSSGVNTSIGNITVDKEHSIGVYVIGQGTSFINEGTIDVNNGGIGVLVQNNGTAENKGTINLGNGISSSGVSSLGMAVYNGGTVFNSGIVNVNKGTGIYVADGAAITNTGTINVDNGIGIEGGGTLTNSGTINVTGSGSPISTSETSESIGSVVIKPDGTIYINDKYISIDGTLTTIGAIVVDGAYVDVTTKTPLFNASNVTGEVKILPNFALTGNGISYEIKGFVNTASGTVDGNKLAAVTSPMFTTKITNKGDLVIAKIPYADLTIGDQYDALDKGLDNILKNSNGTGRDAEILKGLNAYLDGLPEENFAVETERKIAQTRGDIYATIQGRMQNINKAFDNSFYEMESSSNFTDDSNKFSVIFTDGNYKDGTTGIDNYDYKVIGLMYMKENENRETGDKYGYTLGFAGSKFKFKDDGGSKEDVYSLRAGVHRSKNLSNEHKVTLLSRAELGYNRHTAKRKLALHETFENKGKYNTYSISLDNKLNKVIYKDLSKQLDIYTDLNLEYGKVENFTEKAGSKGGLEVKVKDNDYFSAELGAGVKGKQRIYAVNDVGVNISGDVKYAYDLGNNYNGNKAKLKNGDEGYYSLITPEKKKGALIGKVALAIEKTDHMGVTFEVEAADEQHKKDISVKYGVRFNYKF